MWYIYSRYLNSALCSWIIKSNYLVVPLTDAAPQFPQKLNPFIHTLLITMPAAGARPKATKIYLIDCTWSRNLPKTQHTSYTYTLTLVKYFSSASHNIILSLSYDLISYTLCNYFYYFDIFSQYFYMFPCYSKRLTYEVSLRNTIHKHSSCSK